VHVVMSDGHKLNRGWTDDSDFESEKKATLKAAQKRTTSVLPPPPPMSPSYDTDVAGTASRAFAASSGVFNPFSVASPGGGTPFSPAVAPAAATVSASSLGRQAVPLVSAAFPGGTTSHPAGAKTPNSHTAALREVELACHKLCEENKLLMDTIQVLKAQVPNPMPDGLDMNLYPNLFAFMGCARIARAEGEIVKASSQAHVTFDQGDWTSSPHPIQLSHSGTTPCDTPPSGALLQELEAILMEGIPVSLFCCCV
jgi:hypothetical protein